MSENIMKINRTTRYTNRATVQGNYFASGVFSANFETDTGIHQIMQVTENAGGRLNYTGVCAGGVLVQISLSQWRRGLTLT
jgi:hypothetical protein